VSALLNAEVGMRNVEKLISRFGLRGADSARPSDRPRTRPRPRPRRRCTSFDFEDEDDDEDDWGKADYPNAKHAIRNP
jgi:hypothetical protein